MAGHFGFAQGFDVYDRGYGNHGGGLYDDEAAIPLIARLPASRATTIGSSA